MNLSNVPSYSRSGILARSLVSEISNDEVSKRDNTADHIFIGGKFDDARIKESNEREREGGKGEEEGERSTGSSGTLRIVEIRVFCLFARASVAALIWHV